MRVVVLHQYTKFQIRKIWRTMCVRINGPDVPDPKVRVSRLFDLETGLRVASKVGNLHSKSGHARPLGSPIIRYVRDGRTDGRTDGQKQRLFPLPYGTEHNKKLSCTSSAVFTFSYFSDLPLRKIKFCSVVFGVMSKSSVINKIH